MGKVIQHKCQQLSLCRSLLVLRSQVEQKLNHSFILSFKVSLAECSCCPLISAQSVCCILYIYLLEVSHSSYFYS